MSITVFNRTFAAPPVNEREILRYAGCRECDDATLNLLRDALKEAEPHLTYKVCYATLPLSISENICDFGCFSAKSLALDRLIAKHSKLSPSRAVMLQAIGSERVEALCDAFCFDLQGEICKNIRPRFSPGYGDLSLDVQKDIFSSLSITGNLSVYLNDSFLMSPSKSVTAFISICK